ncbi:hypothetical protein ACFL1G_00575 [Planctomycetota bacterium]
MNGADSNHCRIVEGSLNGSREVDEQTFASLAVLGERLERLHKDYKIFGEVGFSPAVKELKNRKKAVAIC